MTETEDPVPNASDFVMAERAVEAVLIAYARAEQYKVSALVAKLFAEHREKEIDHEMDRLERLLQERLKEALK